MLLPTLTEIPTLPGARLTLAWHVTLEQCAELAERYGRTPRTGSSYIAFDCVVFGQSVTVFGADRSSEPTTAVMF